LLQFKVSSVVILLRAGWFGSVRGLKIFKVFSNQFGRKMNGNTNLIINSRNAYLERHEDE